MVIHGTASSVRGPYVELQAAVLKALPRDIDDTLALKWANNGEALERGLREMLIPPSTTVAPTFRRDMRKEGWTLLEDVEDPAEISAGNLDLVPFLKKGESRIDGEELVRRARGELRANLGQRHTEYLLEHQDEIPEEFRKYYLAFTGTVWRGRSGYRRAACLCWRGKRWDLDFYWLDSDFRSGDRVVRPRE